MDGFIFRKAAPLYDVTPVDNIFIMEYMSDAPEGYVKAYLFGLMQSACVEADELSLESALNMSAGEVTQAFKYWESLGLVRIISGAPLRVEYQRTWQERHDVAQNEGFGKYAELVKAISNITGTRIFTASELRSIFDWIEVFGLEEAAALMCIRYCIELKGARVSVKYMDAVAKSWADNGRVSAQDVEAYLIEQQEGASGARAILKRFRNSRRPTEDELAMYNSWIEQGFDEKTILSACGELTTVGTPSFRALDRVLETYKINGAFTVEAAIEYKRSRDMICELAREMFEHSGIKRTPKATEIDTIEDFFTRKHIGTELMLLAADYARDASQQFAAIKKTLNDWYESGAATLEAAKARMEKKQTSAPNKAPLSHRGRYGERKYSQQDLRNIGINLLDDEE